MKLKFFYMRQDNTFLPLSENVYHVIEAVKNEGPNGTFCVFYEGEQTPHPKVHYHPGQWDTFVTDLFKWWNVYMG